MLCCQTVPVTRGTAALARELSLSITGPDPDCNMGRTDLPGGYQDTLVASITQRLWPMGNDTAFIPGHGPESTFGAERRDNPYGGGT